MVETGLTREMIDAGNKLLTELDKHDIDADVAFWFYSPESESWKLVIAQPHVYELGAMPGYSRIQKVLPDDDENGFQIKIYDISLLDRNAPLVSLLRKGIKPGPGGGGSVSRTLLSRER